MRRISVQDALAKRHLPQVRQRPLRSPEEPGVDLSIRRRTGSIQVSLLIYVNPVAVLPEEEMISLTQAWRTHFISIRLLCGATALRTWPTSRVLRAREDPFQK